MKKIAFLMALPAGFLALLIQHFVSPTSNLDPAAFLQTWFWCAVGMLALSVLFIGSKLRK
ncbi:MAG: hypothetical protein J0I14_10810 [Propionibacteriaceae bacterium]|jgi:hypothetical protein|nr:hypothetical protein [Propionibacteriaceae bacterium]